MVGEFILKVKSEPKPREDFTYFRSIEPILIFKNNQKNKAFDLYEKYFGRGFKRDTIYNCEIDGTTIWKFILASIQTIF